jgi:uncharacterized membrane protein YidH (DUF202 family)
MTAPQRPGGQTRSVDHIDVNTAERVEFAWHRSGLALAAIGLAIVRRTLPQIAARPTVGGVLIGVGVASTLAAALFRVHTQHGAITRRAQMRLISGAAIAIGVLALAVGAGA